VTSPWMEKKRGRDTKIASCNGTAAPLPIRLRISRRGRWRARSEQAA
jgi:hypothetical protein